MSKSTREFLDQVRTDKELNRHSLRDESLMQHRCINEVQNTEVSFNIDDVKKIALQLKSNSGHETEVLVNLKKAFIQNKVNLVSFLEVEGALHQLIGLLINKSSYIQLLAAECCCNLSLGDNKVCSRLTKAGAPYFITCIKSLNFHLANVCLLVVGNLCASNEKCFNLLRDQGLLEALVYAFTEDRLREYSAQALIFYTRALSSLNLQPFETELLNQVTQTAIKNFESFPEIQWLIFHLSTMESTASLLNENELFLKLLNSAIKFNPTSYNLVSVTSILRIFGNLSSLKNGSCACFILISWDAVRTFFEQLLKLDYVYLKGEIVWVLGNICNHESYEVQSILPSFMEDILTLAS